MRRKASGPIFSCVAAHGTGLSFCRSHHEIIALTLGEYMTDLWYRKTRAVAMLPICELYTVSLITVSLIIIGKILRLITL